MILLTFFCIIEMNVFWGDLTDILAKTKLLLADCFVGNEPWRLIQNGFGFKLTFKAFRTHLSDIFIV